MNKIGEGSDDLLYPEGGSIGVTMNMEECPLCKTEFIPYLVKVCCDVVNERGLDIVGIYRVPGNKTSVSYLTEQVNKGVENFDLEDQYWQDVGVVSSLLKSFFLKLPDPLFTLEMYSSFIEASKIDIAHRRMDQLRKLVYELPKVNLETLKYLTSHLCKVAENSTINKMEVMNLADVFGPILVRNTDINMVPIVTDMSQQGRIIETLLTNWEYFFNEEEFEVKEETEDSRQPLGIGVSNQSLMLDSLHKLEEAGKVGSPSIIPTANKEMLRAATNCKYKSSVDWNRAYRHDIREGARHEDNSGKFCGKICEIRDGCSGALQNASFVPGLSRGEHKNGYHDTAEAELPPGCSRQNSSGSQETGSVSSHCLLTRGSICDHSGGKVCEVPSVGEVCETRIAMIESDSEMVSNGLGGHQEVRQMESQNRIIILYCYQVVNGKLSLVDVQGFPMVSHELEEVTDHPSSIISPSTAGVERSKPTSNSGFFTFGPVSFRPNSKQTASSSIKSTTASNISCLGFTKKTGASSTTGGDLKQEALLTANTAPLISSSSGPPLTTSSLPSTSTTATAPLSSHFLNPFQYCQKDYSDQDCSFVIHGGHVVNVHLAVLHLAWPRVMELLPDPAACHCDHTFLFLPWADVKTVEFFIEIIYTGKCGPVDQSELLLIKDFLQGINASLNLSESVETPPVEDMHESDFVFIRPIYGDIDNCSQFINRVGSSVFNNGLKKDATIERPQRRLCSKSCLSDCSRVFSSWTESQKLTLENLFKGKSIIKTKNNLIHHLKTQSDIGVSSDNFQVNNHMFCNDFLAHVTDVSVYLIKTVLHDFWQGMRIYEHGNSGILKQQISTTQFIVWLKEFSESYGQFSPDENKVILNYWLKKNVLFKMYIEETQSPHLRESTFYDHFDHYFGPRRVDKSLPCIRKIIHQL